MGCPATGVVTFCAAGTIRARQRYSAVLRAFPSPAQHHLGSIKVVPQTGRRFPYACLHDDGKVCWAEDALGGSVQPERSLTRLAAGTRTRFHQSSSPEINSTVGRKLAAIQALRAHSPSPRRAK